MKTSWFIGIIMLFGIFTVISGIIEMNTMGSDDISILQSLMQPQIPEFTNPLGAVFAVVNVAWDYLQVLWDVLWFDYAFFQGQWLYVKYLVFWPISVALVISLVFVLRGVGSD